MGYMGILLESSYSFYLRGTTKVLSLGKIHPPKPRKAKVSVIALFPVHAFCPNRK